MDADAKAPTETTTAAVNAATASARKRWGQITAAGVMMIQVDMPGDGWWMSE